MDLTFEHNITDVTGLRALLEYGSGACRLARHVSGLLPQIICGCASHYLDEPSLMHVNSIYIEI
jgi:hypothetical protein